MLLGKFRFLFIFLILLNIVLGNLSLNKVEAASSSSIAVDVVPQNPAPYEEASISLSSYANNLDNVSISWYVNGKLVLSGIGKKSFSVKVGASGSETLVKAVINLPDGEIETSILLTPSVMVLLWQANDSHTPPFYKGKALATPDSEIKIVAMPEIKNGKNLVSPKNMTYTWKRDYTNEVDASGYGKNYFTYINDYLDDSSIISVVADTIDQKYSSSASITTTTTEPKVLFYKNDNNLGTLWEKNIESPYRIEESVIIQAVPYFLSPKELQHPYLIWNWSINDSIVDVLNFRKNFMPLKVDGINHGTSKVKLNIEHRNKIFQTVNKEINIEF
jgi:hypothetical protein